MANEPNNAEEQLKQYADDRRQSVPQEIHPATRNLLQGEVARTYGTVTKRAPMRLRWLPALAWIVVLAAIPLFFMPRSPESKKATETVPSKESEAVLSAQPKAGEAPIQMSDTANEVKPLPKVALTTPAEVAPAATPAPAPVRNEPLVATKAERDAVTVQRTRAVQTPTSPKPEARQVAASAGAAAAPTKQQLSFVNNLSTPHALNNFRIEQVGARFSVVDADGSVYPGRETTNGGFYVAGVNKVLKQTVVFTGQVTVANSPVSNLGQQQQQISNTANNSAQNVQNQSLFNNTANVSQDVRVQGQATVGRAQYKIDAQSTPAQ